ncbi:MAG TPA: enolase C-terminal domain-like protein [Pseudonocardiaceae bacterium]|jgi:L-alanine-DL-glutamate epimerase-like enolase superfamily enzyme|nr:enolase C-terminal domain-like protein [Pseudonocardiaceae bacterium]
MRVAPDVVVESVDARAYTIPTDAPEGDGTAAWSATTLVVVRAYAGGQVGTGWTYGAAGCAALVGELLAEAVTGRDALAVPGAWSAMVRAARNATRAGAVGYAISAVDVALWDLKARLLDVSLVRLLGTVHEAVPIYSSGGFTTYSDELMVQQLTGWTHEQRIPRVKIKIGESWGAQERRDLARIARAREVIGPDVELYVDANGGYQRKQAVRMATAMAQWDVRWFEEPVSSDDLDGLREVRDRTHADVTAGEYGTDVTYFRRMCAHEAVDCLQIDATRCGGYTEWLRSAAVAAGFGLTVSGHCAPNLHAPVASATPNLRHLEWFHDHVRIESMLFSGALDPTGGTVVPVSDRPGHGLELIEDRAERYRVMP